MHLYRKINLTMLLLICLFSFTSFQFSSSTRNTLIQGDSLNATSHLVSAGNVFTLGFFTPNGTINTYIAIWPTIDNSSGFYDSYDVVWIGNRDNPIPNYSSANLTISSRGSLLITTREEDTITLYASSEVRQNVSATLYDTGNFVLKEVSTSGEDVILWQSFDYPTDILLPGMKLGVDHKTGRRWRLTSWLGRSNPASGHFTCEWESITGRLIIRNQGLFDWTSGEKFENISPSDLVNYNLTNFTSNDEEYFMYSLIHDERVLNRGAWKIDTEGGIFDTNTGFPLFSCDRCSCRHDQREEFHPVPGYFRLPNGGSPLPVPDLNLDISYSDCMESCRNDCECSGITRNGSGCMYWIGSNLKFVKTNLVEYSSADTYVQVKTNLVEYSNNRKTGMMMLMWIISSAVVTALVLLLAVAALVRMRQSKRRKGEVEMNELLTLEGYTEMYEHEKVGTKGNDLRLFTYASVVAATRNFSSEYKLGEGGFGPVYKGQTTEGREIAVKVLSKSSGQGLLEFKTELILISKLQHVNLVKLVGFCIQQNDKIIIYDYMPNKSLDFFLFDTTKREQLDWVRRVNIIEGITQGLLYLHKHSRLSIVHRDLKCSNILLDENLNPKISDFGLARIFKQNIVEANTNRRVGTFGYMAPEYAMQGIFSFKSDVYSFGVLVLETVTGRKNSSFHHIEGPLNLVEYAWELWGKNSVLELMDPTLSGSCNNEQFHKFINIGLLCVENRAVDRPNIEEVLAMVKNETTSLPLPKNPAFITRNSVIQELGTSTPDKLSANEFSISEMGGR